jgi:hypothetical protein
MVSSPCDAAGRGRHDYCRAAGCHVSMIAIALIAMKRYAIDAYVLDVLMADLVGHDRTPAAFLVYLCLACAAERKASASIAISLQDIAVRTGLAKSTVQAAIRHLKKRGLLDANVAATTAAPLRRVARPWAERRARALAPT